MNNKKASTITGTIFLLMLGANLFLSNQTVAQRRSLAQNVVDREYTPVALGYASLVKKVYQLNSNRLIWFFPSQGSYLLRLAFKQQMDSSSMLGLVQRKYHINELFQNCNKDIAADDTSEYMQCDRIFTDALIGFSKNIYQGVDIDHWISYDEFTKKFEEKDNDYLVQNIANIKSAEDLLLFFRNIEPRTSEYLALKKELSVRAGSLSPFQKKQLSISMNFCRWIHHFNLEKYIVVNIASATLRYYEGDSIKLNTKVVVGKPATRTPRFAAHCNQVILYPYWNVPSGITLKELLPKFKSNPRGIDEMNMQVIDMKGKIVDHHTLNWQNYSSKYFPFRIRQSTGCDNSLGVLKFNLTSPLGVYLHDTNNKAAFLSRFRYYSHGCIRVEEPVKLANYLLVKKVDNKFLESCLKDQIPVTMDLAKPVPVFVIYQTAETNLVNAVKYYKDVYGLLN